MGKEKDRQRARILRFLAHGAATVSQAGNGKGLLLDGGDRGKVSVDRETVAHMLRAGVVQFSGDRLTLAEGARRRGDSPASSAFQDQHRDLDTATIDTGSGPQAVCINVAESPLGLLLRRRGKDGAPFLSRSEFEAGERLRADFTRGQLMPRLGANWVASVASGRRDGGIAELTDAALAARLRVERAVVAVGPELSGILIDVCCFLKGMETVEIERGWPVRSAKIVLKAALGALSRHYQPTPPAGRNGRQHVLHWGASDYRPSLD